MINNFPIWLVALDYFLACLMVILLINFILNLFLSETSNFILYRFITKLANPIINITNKITPSFIVQPLIPIYIAWLIFMIRIYILPLLLGYSYMGKFAFVFEKDLITQVKSIFLNIAINLNYGM
tara:strand:- start:436 stop:810 length:375 start_codon:yes stop_codon:yes gene_type:complete